MDQQSQKQKKSLTARTMFSYMTKTNIPWQFSQYQPLKKYQKGKEPLYIEKSPTKKGSFLDEDIKRAQLLPSANHYQQPNLWPKKSNKSPKIDKDIKKITYLDLIQTEQTNRPKPGPGAYQSFLSQQQIQKQNKMLYNKSLKKHYGQKIHFYQDFEFLSNQNPGPGNYNPKKIQKKIKQNNKNYRYWVQKHDKQEKSFVQKKKKQPDYGTYTPCAIQYNTFHRYSQQSIRVQKQQKKTKNQSKGKRKPWGSAERFDYMKKINPKKTLQKRPEPGTYQIMLDWPQKITSSKKPKKRVDWINRLSRTSMSVYH